MESNMPAFPSPSDTHGVACKGLTKFEYFVAHAPQMPDWYRYGDPCPEKEPHESITVHLRRREVYEERVKQVSLFHWPIYYANQMCNLLKLQ